MSDRICQNCIYAVALESGSETNLACVNKAGFAGRLRFVDSDGSCRNLRLKNHGRDKAPSAESEKVRFIPLTRGKFAIVDAEDYEELSRYKWHLVGDKNNFYASRAKGGKRIAMHRKILNASKGLLVDHIDGNGLNNRKSNLRLCNHAQNARNSRPSRNGNSKYKGVCRHKRRKMWTANIYKSGKLFFLGYFKYEKEAARAYDKKAAELFGEFAYLNFPKEKSRCTSK